MGDVIDMKTRKPRPPLRLVQYDDVRIAFAREIERLNYELENVVNLETRKYQGVGDAPCDTQPGAA